MTLRIPAGIGIPAFHLLSLLASAPAAATAWNQPEQITHNGVEDRTTSGSLIHPCLDEAYAVWMQEQDAPGWRLMWSSRDASGWREPEPVDPGDHPDFEPRLGLGAGLCAVWQRGSGSAAEIVFAEWPFGGPWSVAMVTANATEDVTPDLPPVAGGGLRGGLRHVVWAGFDSLTQTGKIFHAVNAGGGWQVERLAESQLGPDWQNAAPRIDVDQGGVVHVVYRGGLFGDYHLHYARKEGDAWTYLILGSLNEIDLSVDVQVRDEPEVVVAMSGTDQMDSPPRIYLRRSLNGGLSFDPPELVTQGFSASLGNLVAGVLGIAISGTEVSTENLETGNLFYFLEGRGPEILPPADMASARPCAAQSGCIPAAGVPGLESVLYVNHGGAGPDRAEVYFLATPSITMVMDGESPSPAATLGLGVRVAPNPFSTSTTIEVTGPMPADRALRDAGIDGLPLYNVSVFDVAGRLVRRLAAGVEAGLVPPAVVWDGKTEEGRSVPAGLYLLRVEWAAGEAASTRMMRVK